MLGTLSMALWTVASSVNLFAYLSLDWQVNLLLTRWMKDLEKIFYGNIVAYDSAMLPEAKPDELANAIWR